MYRKIGFVFGVSLILFSCSNNPNEVAEHQRITDSIAKAEAEALEMEAVTAQKMLDSTEAVNSDTTKK